MGKAFAVLLIVAIIIVSLMVMIMVIVVLSADSKNIELRSRIRLLKTELEFIKDKEKRKTIVRDKILFDIKNSAKFKGNMEKIKQRINDWEIILNYEKIRTKKIVDFD